MRYRILSAVFAAYMAMAPLHNAQAILGVGDIVYDPANHVENILTAIRSLEQINNQVQQLANEAQMLINQARNLTSLPTTIAPDLQSSLWRIDSLIGAARGIAYNVTAIDAEYQRLFPEQYAVTVSTSQVLQDAQETWALARGGFQHSLNVQAEVIGQIRSDTLLLDRLVTSSQSAVGNLQVAQAGNQLTALAAKQSMQLQSLMAASSRADALEHARALAARTQGKARFENFLGDRSAYTPQ